MGTDYTSTLNLPRTSFPMRANLPRREKEFISWWEERKIYQRMLEGKKKTFILHDGPPYANGDIHMGQAYNKILKDMVLKSKALSGYATPFIPGWDCHGLPVEYQLLKEWGGKRKEEVNPIEFRKRAREYAQSYVNRQREEFRRLEIFADWDNPYLTMDYPYQAKIMEVFLILFDRGFVYRDKKPVYWCCKCETALAEAEVEYQEKVSPSIWVKFPLLSPSTHNLPPSSFILIWTTTPWTLPGNLGVTLHPEEMYIWMKVGEEVWLIGEKAAERVEKELGIQGKPILRLQGKEMEGWEYNHPLLPRVRGKILLGDYVSMEEGSGCVHTAPGHGEEDYLTGRKYGLPPFSPVDEKGRFTSEVERWQGMHIEEANTPIMEELKNRGYLVKRSEIRHSYPHCWRCKNPVIFRATLQWFLKVDKDGLRKKAIEKLEDIKWYPSPSRNRMRGMLETRPDWCLSRQRIWGVPIPVFYCEECGKVISGKKYLSYTIERVKREGSDIWFEESPRNLLPEGFRCPFCEGDRFRKETDILDVWMDSGVSHLAVLKERPSLSWPADMYLEGSDQHRGWFQTSLLVSLSLEGEPPYLEVLTHGFVVDSEGRKMSKSLGNVVDPQEMVERFGAEILRIWVASSDYSRDIRISEEILQGHIDAYKKIRNTLRFMLGNLYDFDPDRDSLPSDKWWDIDRWIYNRLKRLIRRVREFYDKYQFFRAFQELYQFVVKELSSLYLDILKDRLYVFPASSPSRRAAQTVIYHIVRDYTRLIAPVLSFTAEEVWQHLREREESVFLSSFPEDKGYDKELDTRWEIVWETRERIYQELEKARKSRVIGSSLEAEVKLKVPEDIYRALTPYQDSLPMILIVSGLELIKGEEWRVEVRKAKGDKCPRCWMWREDVGEDREFPEVCGRCAGFLREVEYAGKEEG